MAGFIDISTIVDDARNAHASDIHMVAGIPIRFRIDGELEDYGDHPLTEAECETYARMISNDYYAIENMGEQDLATSFPCGVRCRVNLFRQQRSVSCAIRLLNDHIPTFEELGLPGVVKSFANYNQGIVIVSGETGSGKSTTLACLLDMINHTRKKHIITLEDPVEYIYSPDKCVINQREVGQDTRSYSDGLKSILREDPDIILIGEMRNRETVETALTAAETGHLVFATLHTNSASDTVDRIVDVFDPNQQAQVRMQLSMTLRACICQQLLPRASGNGRVLASEVMVVNNAIQNLIREGKTPQIANAIATGANEGSMLMDSSIVKLYKDRKISKDTAMYAAKDQNVILRGIVF